MLRAVSCLPAFLLLAACGAQVTAPSLLPRAVERRSVDMPATASTEADTAADPALLAAIKVQLDAATAADRGFAARRGAAEAAVAHAAGAPVGSETWVTAQEAISALETERQGARDSAAAVDALRDAPANAAPGNRAAIDDAAARIGAIEQAEQAAVAGLTGRLR